MEPGHPSNDSNRKFLFSIVFLIFLAGSLCTFPLGFWFGTPLFIIGIAAVISAICVSFIFGGRDRRLIFHQLTAGSAPVFGTTMMSFTMLEQNKGGFGSSIGTGICCIAGLCIVCIVFIATVLATRKKRPLMDMLLSFYLVITLYFVAIYIAAPQNLARLVSNQDEETIWPWVMAQALLYCGLAITAMASFLSIHFSAWNNKRKAREQEFFVARSIDEQAKK